MTHVLLWDIDGTLLTTARAGVFALEEAAREVCRAVPDFSALPTSGLTDSEVAELAIRTVGAAPEPATVSAFLRAYERHLPDRLHRRRGRVLTRVAEVLDDLARRPGVHSLLLTGNTRAGAAAKLAHYGLAGYFEDGAFCADGDDRLAIARRAWALAAGAAGGELDRDHVFVIGDTPHDVRAGDAIGVRTVAIATGVHPLAELEACAPWLALPELPEPARFAALLGLP
jgi:phosphoglycolate phosphatase-like HAD superfamily hydrolase